MQKTYIPKAAEIDRDWVVVNAEGKTLGRLASQIAALLRGKDKPNYTPGMDTGAFVVVTNIEKIVVTGNRLDDKTYYRYSGYPGGLKSASLRQMLDRHPDRVIRSAVWGMLPKNRLGRKLVRKLKVYTGPEHPHAAQMPRVVEL